MKYFSGEIDTLDGETLRVILPTQLPSQDYAEVYQYDKLSYRILYNGEFISVRKPFLNDDLCTSIKTLQKSLRYSLDWMNDSRKAKPLNPDIYIVKCKEAMEELRCNFSEIFPELFI